MTRRGEEDGDESRWWCGPDAPVEHGASVRDGGQDAEAEDCLESGVRCDGGESSGNALGEFGDEEVRQVSPALVPLVSAFERAATLIEKGVPPAKAMRQVVQELQDYEQSRAGTMIPPVSFAAELGVPQRPLQRQ
jgi:hypothetical protein